MSPPSPRSARRPKKRSPASSSRPFVAHHMVPPHEVLSEADTKAMLDELHTSAERLPKIFLADPGLKTDPAFVKAREAGENLVGRLVRVRRPSETAGVALAYRLIVSSSGGE